MAQPPKTHVVILDGTMSSVAKGFETHAGLTWKLLASSKPLTMRMYYEPGIQWRGWANAFDVMAGVGINRQIQRAYRWLAQGYAPGDRVIFLGYSRGAYAVRSLAGVIERQGLLRPEHATERNVRFLYRYYREARGPEHGQRFARRYCWPQEAVSVEMIGVWDTVKALGLRVPLLWKWSRVTVSFHHDQISSIVKAGYHALARDERRVAFTPVLWRSAERLSERDPPRIEQVWFRGTHGDVGGQTLGFEPARPLANISLVWMLEHAERHGLALPEGWRAQFPRDSNAPSVGMNRGFGLLFAVRAPRVIGVDRSERMFDGSTLPHPPRPLLHRAGSAVAGGVARTGTRAAEYSRDWVRWAITRRTG